MVIEKEAPFRVGSISPKWAYLARSVASWSFDLDNIRTQISQELGAKAGLLIGQI
jgi:hypothetical protein